MLERVHAAPGVRLACQLRPTRDIAFVPMISPNATTVDAYRTGAAYSGVERYVVIMFVDMRGSSRLAEGRLPFDTVFVINQFLNAVSGAVLKRRRGAQPDPGRRPFGAVWHGRSAGSRVPAGDRRMRHDRRQGRGAEQRARLRAARTHPLRDRVHAGVTIAGNIGFERHAQFTVIGDPVNVAARLEGLTKPFGCEVMMSEEVYQRAGFGADDLPAHEVDARGRDASVKVRSVAKAADLPR